MLYSRGSSLRVSVPEQAVMFLSVLSHHKKNCVVKHDFIWFDRTVSKHFHAVMLALCKLHKILLAKPTLITDECADPRWKWFKGCLGALDVYICSKRVRGSATDSRVLRDALHRPSGLHVPTELEKEEPSKGRLQNSLYAIAQVTELKKEEPSKEKLQNSLYAIPQVQELENEEHNREILRIILSTLFFKAQEYSKVFKAKIESFVKDTIKLALTNFGTLSGTTLPFTKEERHYMDTQGKIVKPVNSKLAISKSTSSNTKNVGITTRNMSKKLKESFQMSPFAEGTTCKSDESY
ncbi:UNVERIFIED_CONTAM: hypothetical protein Scaly_2732600 [Sesamum calycinum]|uniref:DUF8040 domain-containing protein n=1 Tax=Sesamum calycinum TaxID=2727403 RepID=A0AAW2J2H6_9LAMI